MKTLLTILFTLVGLLTFSQTDIGPYSASANGTFRSDANDMTNPTNAYTNNGSFAEMEVKKRNIQGWSYETFSMATIPGGSTINGITVELEDYFGATIVTATVGIYCADDATVYTKTSTINYTATGSYDTYGGTGDVWGGTWVASDFTDANFYVEFEMDPGTAVNVIEYIDHVRVSVRYTAATGYTREIDGVSGYTGINGSASSGVTEVDGVGP